MAKINRHPNVPRFVSGPLESIALAFGHRAKALKYSAKRFSVERELEGEIERLNVDLKALTGESIRLSVWSTEELWLSLVFPGSGRNSGWRYKAIGIGSFSGTEPNEIVGLFERSVTFRELPPEKLEQEWQSTNLAIVEFHGIEQ